MKKKQKFKIIVINNSCPIRKSIDYVMENDNYNNHFDYWKEYLTGKHFETVNQDSIYSDTRDIIGIKICLEGNIVFIDTSNPKSNYKSGLVYLPQNVKSTRKKLMKFLTSDYDYLTVISDIKYKNGRPIGKYNDIQRDKGYSKKKLVTR